MLHQLLALALPTATDDRALRRRLRWHRAAVTDEEEFQIVLPTTVYALFNTERGGLPAVVVANRALERFEHRDIFPWHLKITIEATDLADKPDRGLIRAAGALALGILSDCRTVLRTDLGLTAWHDRGRGINPGPVGAVRRPGRPRAKKK